MANSADPDQLPSCKGRVYPGSPKKAICYTGFYMWPGPYLFMISFDWEVRVPSPTNPVIQVKFNQAWPTSLRDILFGIMNDDRYLLNLKFW